MDQETVERLLGGPVVDPQDVSRPVASLLTAVRAAPLPGELTGEDAAVRAYRLARAGTPVGTPARGRSPMLARLGVRAAIAGAALVVTGGVAYAATGGTLPGPLRGPAPSTAPATAPAPHGSAPAASPTRAEGRPATPGSTVDVPPEQRAAVTKLCRAYRADGDDPDRALDKPVYDGLVRAAGGRGKVTGLCDRLLSEAPESPGGSGTPTDRPGVEPTARPTGRPAISPSVPAGLPPVPGVQVTPGIQVTPGGVQLSPDRDRRPPSSGDER
ncbi:hypothetical protein [Micromonospora citrea]|nr:hypothetical protein [Micromonospora citrea]